MTGRSGDTGSNGGLDDGSFSWRIGGMAGEGIDTAGDVFAKALMRAGWHVWTSRHFPSRIRGGLTTYTTRLAQQPVTAPVQGAQMIVALHEEAADPQVQGLREPGLVLYDSPKVKLEEQEGVRLVPLDCTGISKELGERRARNMVALGASARLLGMPLEVLVEVVRERFDAKAREVRLRARLVNAGAGGGGGEDQGDGQKEASAEPALVTLNRQALQRGWEAVKDEETLRAPGRPLQGKSDRLFVSGNEAFAYGAVVAGCRFYAGYPITPATTIMEYLSARLPAFGGVSLQVEDELAALSMAIGAGFNGTRAMTASSGPGLSLMAEGIALAGSTETPVVIVDCMRPGPSTGMPTKTAQEDISYLLSPSHSEAPHIVLAAEDLSAAYRTALDAFNLAEQYQCPVIVALDASISIGKGDSAPFPLEVQIDRGARFTKGADTPGAGQPQTGEGYERYRSRNGSSPLRAVPGDVGGRHYANSTEHGPAGYTTEDPEVRREMVERRRAKFLGIDEVHAGTRLEGEREAPLGLVAFGSMVPVAREALAWLKRMKGVEGSLLVLRRLKPLPRGEVEEFMQGRDVVVVVEGNSTGQLLRHLRSEVPEAHHAFGVQHYTGEPLTVDGLVPKVQAVLEEIA